MCHTTSTNHIYKFVNNNKQPKAIKIVINVYAYKLLLVIYMVKVQIDLSSGKMRTLALWFMYACMHKNEGRLENSFKNL